MKILYDKIFYCTTNHIYVQLSNMDNIQKDEREQYNVPATELPKEPFSKKDFYQMHDNNGRIPRIAKEFQDGFNFIEKHQKTVTVFGSARTDKNDPHYEHARNISERIVKELGYGVVTGGGPGIMEAANEGAHEAGGISLGLNIKLPKEQRTNAYLTDSQAFHYFFTRKMLLSFAAEAYLFFPGGFGTLDELFEMLTLVQTKKIAGTMPIILIGSDYWRQLDTFITDIVYRDHHAISPQDIDLYTITDNDDTVLELIKKAPIRT